MSWRGGIKRTKTDILFSWLIRERAEWKCEYCKKDFSHNTGRLHCSHIYSRGNKAVRVHPLNALAHCMGCHEYLDKNPLAFTEHVQDVIGKEKQERLNILANTVTRFSKADTEYIHRHYLKEKKRLQQLRGEGVTGRIEFTLP